MREIKFRAWDGISKQMLLPGDGSNVCVTATGSACMDETDDGGILENRSYRLELMQFTGLRDANGVQVYEGDVVEDHVGVGVVKYSEDNAGFRVSYGNGRAKWFYDYTLSGERESIVVIGNLHQNPELMEDI